MSHLKDVLKHAAPPTQQEISDMVKLVHQGLDDQDMQRMVLYRRAVRLGYYNEGPEDS